MARRLVFAVILIASGFAAGLVLTGRMRDTSDAGAQVAAPAPTITAPGALDSTATLTDFSRIAERTVPAVVNVSAQQIIRRQVYDPWAGFFGSPDGMYRSRRGVEGYQYESNNPNASQGNP